MRPGAGQRDIEMVAATGRREAAITGWSWRAIGCHPVAELRVGTDKLAALTLGVIPLINPLSIDK